MRHPQPELSANPQVEVVLRALIGRKQLFPLTITLQAPKKVFGAVSLNHGARRLQLTAVVCGRGRRRDLQWLSRAVSSPVAPQQEAEASGGEELQEAGTRRTAGFIEYLAEQLSAGQQAKFETEFGGGQGYIVKLPSSSWKTKRKRDELESWIRALGFTSGATLKRNALRIASLKADVILSELRQKVPLIAEYVAGERGYFDV
ncbi:hypothetical protein GQ600_21101 [Phytophthora cactorum]|nr:hypothetical protein GQ600_21101 [Phytophthora cactorum]